MSSTVEIPRNARQEVIAARKRDEAKTHKSDDVQEEGGRDNGLTSLWEVNTVPESLSISHRGSGLRKALLGSGLSTLRLEGCALPTAGTAGKGREWIAASAQSGDQSSSGSRLVDQCIGVSIVVEDVSSGKWRR